MITRIFWGREGDPDGWRLFTAMTEADFRAFIETFWDTHRPQNIVLEHCSPAHERLIREKFYVPDIYIRENGLLQGPSKFRAKEFARYIYRLAPPLDYEHEHIHTLGIQPDLPDTVGSM